MAAIYNALHLKNGARVERNRMGVLTQPIQFLPRKEKDEEWGAWNMDWLEMQGTKQLRRNARRLLKNYKLANGIIDKTDYLVEQDAENAELMDLLTREDDSALELKFYPIIPNIINVFCGEFQKRNDKITYRAVDELSYNEMLEEKRSQVEDVLIAQAEQKMQQKMQQLGLTPDSEEGQQMLAPESLKSLPEIEGFFKKDYRSLIEEWAGHQHNADEERFKMRELENTGFRDSLIADREFWHFKLGEDDYEIELWNPVLTFYHKSPNVRYTSQGNMVGKIDAMSVSDVIDNYGYKMSKEQLESLQSIYPVKSAMYAMSGYQNDGSFYDATRSHEWNTNRPSLGMRQLMSVSDDFVVGGDDIIDRILGESEDMLDAGSRDLLRVTTAYWKSQKMVGHLTFVDDMGDTTDMIVDETFRVTVKPVYDQTVLRGKRRENLVYGQHVEWIWINEVWGGIKIGANTAGFYGNSDAEGFSPIYLDVAPIRFQFKGDFSLYGCMLPVEGCVFSDRNTKSTALVDRLKPFQIGYNMVNNQIADILIDELGTVIMLDQNALPKSSMGEDWGANNFEKAFVAMKNFQMLPVDSTISNTEQPLSFQHYQVLNLEQTARLMSRIQLATYFKQQAFECIGFTPERMGKVVSQQTATAVEQNINQSYAQTEVYFTQHSEYLMPRVHQRRTDCAQYYHSNNPSVRLSYLTSMDEKMNFQMNGTELLARDLNVFVSTKVNTRQVTEQIKQLALTNNTAGASVYDLGNLIKADSLAEVDRVLKTAEEKTNKLREQEQEHERQMQQQQLEAAEKEKAAQRAYELEKQDRLLQNNIDVAEIKGVGFQTPDDQTDYMEGVKQLGEQRHREAQLELAREKDLNARVEKSQDRQLKREELAQRERIADKQVQVARINKNKYDKPAAKK